jgi:hypothetical protein
VGATSPGVVFGVPIPESGTVVTEFSPEAHQSILENSNVYFEERTRQKPQALIGIAQGDSWFDYLPAYFEDPIHGDLLGHLNRSGEFNIIKAARAGDTLENMAYGTSYDKQTWQPAPAGVEHVLVLIKEHNPKFFMFSAGGNDATDEFLEAYLNHKDSGLPLWREEYFRFRFFTDLKTAYLRIIDKVKSASPNIHIFLHGYAYAIPDGRGVFRVPPHWTFIGPWLRPPLTKKRILEMSKMRQIINRFIDALNDVLAGLENLREHTHYVDLRSVVEDKDWVNEVHPSASTFGRIAETFANRIHQEVG